MRNPIKLPILLAVMLFGLSLLGGAGVGAQEAAPNELMPSELDGIQYGVSRSYTFDWLTVMASMASPDAELTMPTGLLSVSAVVLEFDSDDHAGAAANRLVNELPIDIDEGDGGTEKVELQLGDSNASYVQIERADGQQTQSLLTAVHDGNYLYLVTGVGSNIDTVDIMTQFIETMMENEGSGEGDFNEDGTSSGGLWDKFPASDSEMLAGLIVADEIIYPEPNESEQG